MHEMDETAVDMRGWSLKTFEVPKHGFQPKFVDKSFEPGAPYTARYRMLRVCKNCRDNWLRGIQLWCDATPPSNSAVANNDSSDAICSKQSLLAEITRLRTEAQAILQRAQDTENDLRNRLQATLDVDKS